MLIRKPESERKTEFSVLNTAHVDKHTLWMQPMCQIFHHCLLREVLEEETKCCRVFLRPSQSFWHSSQGANLIFRLCRDAIKETNRLMGRSVLLQGVPSVQTQH